jgi:hypothetical protein
MTGYFWPTWADILGQQWEYFENWGEPGAGNNFILNSVIECDTRNQFTVEDQIMIMWTGCARIDYYQQNCWCHMTNVFAKDNTNVPVSCPDGYEILSYAWFSATKKYLEYKNIPHLFLSFVPYDNNSKAGMLYKKTLESINYLKFNTDKKNIKMFHDSVNVQNFYNRVSGEDWPSLENILNSNYTPKSDFIKTEIEEFVSKIKSDPHYAMQSKDVIDNHPLPLQHLEVVQKSIPNFAIDDSTVEWVHHINDQIQNKLYYNFDRKKPLERF